MLTNSQCALLSSDSYVADATGSDLRVNLTLNGRGNFLTTAKQLCTRGRDNELNDTGWVPASVWNP